MNKILPITKTETINQENNILKLFERDTSNSYLEEYNINFKASNVILIATTKGLSKELIYTLQSYKKSSIYIILSSFNNQKDTLESFDNKRPAIIRENPNLKNNFIYTDKEATIYINSLSNEKNVGLKLGDEYRKDLYYWFNYYFWSNCTKEKILDKTSSPKESPYPNLLNLNKEYINKAVDISIPKIDNLFVPKDNTRKYVVKNSNFNKCFISEDIHEFIYKYETKIRIGDLIIKDNNLLNIGNTYVYKKDYLKNINETFITYEDDWSTSYNIESYRAYNLDNIRAKDIESMNNTINNNRPSFPYCLKIQYQWQVLPPIKPKKAQQSNLYNQYKSLQFQLLDNIKTIDQMYQVTIKDSLLDKLKGFKNSLSQNEKKINEWKAIDLENMELSKIRKKLNEFEVFFNSVVKTDEDFYLSKDKEKARIEYENNQEKINKKLNKLKDYRKGLRESLEENSIVSDDLKKHNINKKKIIKKEISLTNEIEQIEKEVKKDFIWENKQNELEVMFSKNKMNQKVSCKPFSIPKFNLPEVGILFEDDKNYYLQIEYYEDLKMANSLKERYCDKDYHVVVKE